MKTLIIEDEFAALQELKALLRDYDPGIELLAELDAISSTVEWFRNHSEPKLELVFLDIHLSDGSAFEIFKYIDIPAPIIFTTAYDEYALEAFRVNSIDYLLKPVDRAKLARALNKYRQLSQSAQWNRLQNLLEQMRPQDTPYPSNLLIPYKDQLIPLPVSQIAYLHIKHGNLALRTFAGETYFLNGALEEFSEKLPPQDFFRVNRQLLAAKSAITNIHQYFNGRLLLKLQPEFPGKVIVSKERAGVFKEWFTS